jgi:hypothetical protein
MRPTVMRAWLALVVCVSCAGTPKVVAAPSPPNDSESAFLRATIGGKPDMSVFIRPKAARGDAYWGPMINRALSGRDNESDFISHSSGMALLDARQIDLHVTVRDPIALKKHDKVDPSALGWVGVIFGLSIDPFSIRDGKGRPLFVPGERLSSGVVSYGPSDLFTHDLGALAPTLFVTRDGTCVVTDPISAPQMRQVLAQTGEPPAPLVATDDSLGGITFGVTSLRFLEKGRNSGPFQGIVQAGYGLRGGRNGAIEGYADYASSDDADRAFSVFQRTCVENSKECVFEPSLFRDAKAERDGVRILVTLAFSEPLLKSLQSY